MGCDIHSVFELLGDDGVWRAIYVENLTEDDAQRLQWRIDDAKFEGRPPPTGITLEWNDRSYNVFSILANVRNGRGFAGVKTGEGFEPIAAGRGFPADASPEALEMSESYGVDGHSHTWVSLAEILDTEWQSKTTVLQGIVEANEYVAWRKANEGLENPVGPDSYCGGVWGAKVRTISAEDAARMLDWDGALEPTVTNVQIQWKVNYAECAKYFMEFIYSRVVILGHDPARVRMVMFFDN